MKMVLESLASSNDEKVPRDVTNRCCRGGDGHKCDTIRLYSTGAEDKRAGGISQQVPECAGSGQRSETDIYHLLQHGNTFLRSFVGVKKPSFSEKLQEGDYDIIADDPSLPASSEAGRAAALVGEGGGRSSGEVNTAWVQTHRMNPRLPVENYHFQPPSGLPDQEFSLRLCLLM